MSLGPARPSQVALQAWTRLPLILELLGPTQLTPAPQEELLSPGPLELVRSPQEEQQVAVRLLRRKLRMRVQLVLPVRELQPLTPVCSPREEPLAPVRPLQVPVLPKLPEPTLLWPQVAALPAQQGMVQPAPLTPLLPETLMPAHLPPGVPLDM